MTIEEARLLRGEKYNEVPDEAIQTVLDLINGVCLFVINTELSKEEHDIYNKIPQQ